VIEAKTQETKDFAGRYFTEYKSNQYRYNVSTKQNIMWIVDNMHEENRKNGNIITDMSYSLVSISGIQKQAANAVRMQFTVNLNITSPYDIQFINLTRPEWGYWSHSRTNNILDDGEIYEISDEYHITLILFKINGEWKIGDAQQWGWHRGSHRAVTIS
jgi:hypothetical protein